MATITINGDLSTKNFNDLPNLRVNDVVKFTITAKVSSVNRDGFPGYDDGADEEIVLGDDIEVDVPSIMHLEPTQKVFIPARNLK